MKPTRKNTTASSEKVKKKIKALAHSKKSTKQPVVSKESTASTPTSDPETLVENKPLDGSMKIDHLPFQTQASMIFNPLQGFNQKSVVGKLPTKDPFAPAAFVVEPNKGRDKKG